MTAEQQRRLDALESATQEMNCAESDWRWDERSACEPFSRGAWLYSDGEINVIYDKNGNVEKRLYIGSAPDADQMRIIIDVANELIAAEHVVR